jgi:hypothetical protein
MAFQKDGLEQLSCMNKNEHGFFLTHTKIHKKKKKKTTFIMGKKKRKKKKAMTA